MNSPAWLPDPTGCHQYRWWEGERWTHHVADDGVVRSEPATDFVTLPPPASVPDIETGHVELAGRKSYLGNGRAVTLASPGARLGAWLIDGAIIAAPLVAPALLVVEAPEDEDITGSDFFRDFGDALLPSTGGDWTLFFIGFFVTFAYQVAFIARKGQTPGKMAAGIQVVGCEDGDVPGLRKALRRWTIPGLLGLIPVAGILLSHICYLSLTWHRNRQGWHDLFAGTMVVRVDQAASQKARWARTDDGQPLLLANPNARIAARLIDLQIILILWLILLFVTVYLIGVLDVGSDVLPFLVVLGLPTIAAGIIYEVTMVAVRGQTLGKMAIGIKVIRNDIGTQPGTAKSLARWSLPGLIMLIPLLGWLFAMLCYLSLTWGINRQGWHDKAAGTLVVVT